MNKGKTEQGEAVRGEIRKQNPCGYCGFRYADAATVDDNESTKSSSKLNRFEKSLARNERRVVSPRRDDERRKRGLFRPFRERREADSEVALSPSHRPSRCRGAVESRQRRESRPVDDWGSIPIFATWRHGIASIPPGIDFPGNHDSVTRRMENASRTHGYAWQN